MNSLPCQQTIAVVLLVSKYYVSLPIPVEEGQDTLRFVSWMRAKDRATIIAHPMRLVNTDNCC